MSEPNDTDKPKQQEQDSPQPAPTPSKTSANERLKLVALFLILSASANASQALIQPLYGYEPTSAWFRLGSFIAVSLFAFIVPESAQCQSRALKAVVALQIFGTALSRSLGVYVGNALGDPVNSALVIHGVVGFPILGLGAAVWLDWMRKYAAHEEATRAGELVVKAFSCLAVSTCIWFIENLVGMGLSYLPTVHPKYVMAALAFSTTVLQLSVQPATPGSKPYSIASPSLSTLTILSLLVASLAVTFPPSTPPGITVLSSRFGGRGLVQVVDMEQTPTTLPMRYLRKDASIVGASYLAPVLEDKGKHEGLLKLDVGETIERKALLLDGVRLVKGMKGKNALVIGAGTGAITSQLVLHGYNTTLIESDPEVLSAARTFFKLREPAEVHVTDASGWLERNAPASAGEDAPPAYKFDIIVHDVVVGGVAPPQLFTMEFWEGVRRVVDDKGVVAVTYTGRPTSFTFRSILNMLLNNFGTCRVYHTSPLDAPPFSQSAPDNITDFTIFCTPSSTLKFRSAGYGDYVFAGHPSRDRILRNFAQREVLVANVLRDTPRDRLLLKVADPRLGHWGKDGAGDVWKYYRETYPAEVWSTY